MLGLTGKLGCVWVGAWVVVVWMMLGGGGKLSVILPGYEGKRSRIGEERACHWEKYIGYTLYCCCSMVFMLLSLTEI